MPSAEKSRKISFDLTLASAKDTMLFSEIVKLAVDSFRANKMRSLLTALGMVIGSASVILVVTIGMTGKQYILDQIQRIGTNLVELDFTSGATSGTENDTLSEMLTREDELAVDAQVPSVLGSSPMLPMHNRISIGSGMEKNTLVLGVSPQYVSVRNLIVPVGRFFDETDENTHAKCALVTIPFAKLMFGSPEAAVGQGISISGIPFTIIGTFKESVDTFGQSEIMDETILIPYSVARYFTGTNTVKKIFFSIRNMEDVPLASQQIVRLVSSRHRPTSVYTVFNMTELLTTAALIANVLTVVLVLVAAVTLAVGGIGIMNIMLATVRSRIQEIGIRKAMGATSLEIKLQFLVEAIFISLVGGVAGCLLGVSVPLGIRFFTDYKLPFSWLSVFVALGTAVIVGAVFGTLPATRAAHMDPVESLKSE
jgi:putative ABC transport system permease protein